jgi:hypothetical protein
MSILRAPEEVTQASSLPPKINRQDAYVTASLPGQICMSILRAPEEVTQASSLPPKINRQDACAAASFA